MNLLLSTGAIVGIVIGCVALLIVIIIICWAISARNAFVRMENQYEEAFHNIDIYLKKRYDLTSLKRLKVMQSTKAARLKALLPRVARRRTPPLPPKKSKRTQNLRKQCVTSIWLWKDIPNSKLTQTSSICKISLKTSNTNLQRKKVLQRNG